MSSFRKSIFELLAEGQDLSVAEKSLVGGEIDKFVQDYRKATGEDPQALFGTIYLIAPRIEAFGFKMPTVDQWRKEDMEVIKRVIERKSVTNTRKERF